MLLLLPCKMWIVHVNMCYDLGTVLPHLSEKEVHQIHAEGFAYNKTPKCHQGDINITQWNKPPTSNVKIWMQHHLPYLDPSHESFGSSGHLSLHLTTLLVQTV